MNLVIDGVESRIVAQAPMEFGGEDAIAHFSEAYQGPVCIMSLNRIVAVVPNVPEALRIAAYAIQPCGGFGSVSLLPAEGVMLTHHNFIEWLN